MKVLRVAFTGASTPQNFQFAHRYAQSKRLCYKDDNLGYNNQSYFLGDKFRPIWYNKLKLLSM